MNALKSVIFDTFSSLCDCHSCLQTVYNIPFL